MKRAIIYASSTIAFLAALFLNECKTIKAETKINIETLLEAPSDFHSSSATPSKQTEFFSLLREQPDPDLRKNVVLLENEKPNKTAICTGAIINSSGHMLTNYHCLEGLNGYCEGSLYDGKKFQADLLASSEEIDLALLKIRKYKGDATPLELRIFTPFKEKEKIVVHTYLGKQKNYAILLGTYMCTKEDGIETSHKIDFGQSGSLAVDSEFRIAGIVKSKKIPLGSGGTPRKYCGGANSVIISPTAILRLIHAYVKP